MNRNIPKLVPETITGIKDPWAEGLHRWSVTSGAGLEKNRHIETDVVIVGSGAGGGVTAELLAKAGLDVVIVEEGSLKTSSKFDMQERSAYRDLYHEGLTQANKDGSIGILQGRSVGGSTTINWTSSFDTPQPTLLHWTGEHGVEGMTPGEMLPWFEKMRERLNIHKWQVPPNANNSVLSNGCEKLGYSWDVIPRNVNGCMNLGYCGMGCPVNAKQSMLVTTIPAALEKGARLYYRMRAAHLNISGDKVTGITCHALDDAGLRAKGPTLTINAKHTVLACGGIHTPGVLLRSNAPDPFGMLGKRTTLHPTTTVFSVFEEPTTPFYGAPQSIYSDHFQWQEVTGPMSYKLEAVPLHPMLVSAFFHNHGPEHHQRMEELPYTTCLAALMRDGFHEESPGGSVELREDGTPVLDYAINDFLLEGIRKAFYNMTEIHFAAGAKRVFSSNFDRGDFTSWKDARKAISSLRYEANHVPIASAHVMGGCVMGGDEKSSMCDSYGNYRFLSGLSVNDGSLFPTSIGANPQLSIYGMAAKNATNLVKTLAG